MAESTIGQNATHPIARPCPAYNRMAPEWQLIHDLRGGTLGMQEAASEHGRWLQAEEAESATNFRARVKRSFLFEGYVDAIDDLLSKPFSKPVEIKGELPPEIAGIEEDADLAGTSLTEFAKAFLRDALDHGTSYVLVDFPQVPVSKSFGDEVESRIRPYCVLLSASNVIGWTEAKGPNGRERLTSMRWKECAGVPTDYGVEEVERVRRMTFVYADEVAASPGATGTVEVWQEVETQTGKTWAIVESYPHTFVGLPIVALPLNLVARMEAKPVMAKLAWLNCKHWQSASDQSNNLRFARIGVLLLTGFADEEGKAKLAIGPNSLVKLRNPDAKLAYVTGGTEGIVVGRQDLVDIEAAMESLGSAPMLQRRPGDQAATSAALSDQDVTCDLQTWARLEEHAIEQILEVAAQWAKVELPEDIEVKIYTEFQIPFAQSQDLTTLVDMTAKGFLSKRTLLAEFGRRKALDAGLDIDKELQDIEAEGPALADMNDPPPDDATTEVKAA